MTLYWERGTTKIYFLAIIFATSVFGIIFWVSFSHPCTNFREATLQTPTQTISLALANTPEEQTRGLGGCKYIPKNSGMYFPIDPPRNAIFWMKDMIIPIDIIWIKNGEIIAINEYVLNEPLDTPDNSLTQYPSPRIVDAVLEVAAGNAKKYGLTKGLKVSLKP